jgi:hypothetical protein
MPKTNARIHAVACPPTCSGVGRRGKCKSSILSKLSQAKPHICIRIGAVSSHRTKMEYDADSCGALGMYGEAKITAILTKRALATCLGTFALLALPATGRGHERGLASRDAFAYVQPACGPLGGSALEFYLSAKQAQDGKYEVPYVLVSINEVS